MVEFVQDTPGWLIGHPVAALAAGIAFAMFALIVFRLVTKS